MIEDKEYAHVLHFRQEEIADSFETLDQISETESVEVDDNVSMLSVKSAGF